MSTPSLPITWFEIPVRKLDRAQTFYETVLATPLRREAMGPEVTLAIFGEANGAVAGCLQSGAGTPEPSLNGTLVYLNAAPALDPVLARVVAAGGRISTPKVQLPDGLGFFAHIVDTEGNRVGLHALA